MKMEGIGISAGRGVEVLCTQGGSTAKESVRRGLAWEFGESRTREKDGERVCVEDKTPTAGIE
jgi:hypothetical protein